MFTSFLILLIPPTIVNAVVPKFYQNRALWEARELPSRIYGWVAFCTANVVAEIPIAILGATIYWALWYWPTGLPTDSSTSGYVFLMTMLFVSLPFVHCILNIPNNNSFYFNQHGGNGQVYFRNELLFSSVGAGSLGRSRELAYAFLSRELGSSAPEVSLVIQQNLILIR
jgi:hypothetical protein